MNIHRTISINSYNGDSDNFYNILGVDINASQDEIKKAFRMLSLKYHPDKNPNNEQAIQYFKKINEAYKNLSDIDLRNSYNYKLMNDMSKSNSCSNILGRTNNSNNNGLNFNINKSTSLEDINIHNACDFINMLQKNLPIPIPIPINNVVKSPEIYNNYYNTKNNMNIQDLFSSKDMNYEKLLSNIFNNSLNQEQSQELSLFNITKEMLSKEMCSKNTIDSSIFYQHKIPLQSSKYTNLSINNPLTNCIDKSNINLELLKMGRLENVNNNTSTTNGSLSQNRFDIKQKMDMDMGIDMDMDNNIYKKPLPICINIDVSLVDVFNGAQIPIQIERDIIYTYSMSNNTKEIETIYIDVYKGIDDGEIITIENKGHIINDKIKGDIKVSIKMINTTEFKRKGLDLIYTKHITLKESLCGDFEFEINLLDGNSCTIKNNKGNIIKPNSFRKYPNMGLTRGSQVGNLIISFTVIFPTKLSHEQIESLSTIL